MPRKRSPRSSGKKLTRQLRATADQRGMGAGKRNAKARASGKALWRLLEDPLVSVRLAAAFSLAVVRDPTTVQGFIAALDGAPSKDVARAAVALGEAGYENAAPYLIAAFREDDPVLSAGLVKALGLLVHRPAFPLLLRALERDVAPAEAAEALGRLGAAEAVPALIRALEHGKEGVRAAAAYALGLLDGATDDEQARALATLVSLRADPSQRVRVCAAVARFERGDPAAPAAIQEALSAL